MPQISSSTLRHAVCGGLSPTARSWVAHYHAGGLLPSELYTSTDELKSLDSRADQKIHAIDMAVAACGKLSDADRANWNAVLQKWQDQHQKNQDIIQSTLGLGAGDAAAATNATYPDVTEMQNRVSAVCPSVIAPTGGASSIPWGTIVIVGLFAAIALTGLWILTPLLLARPRALPSGAP